MKNAGKSSLILRFLDRDEKVIPSVALEYTYGRKGRPMSNTKDVCHIWELAGGKHLSSLLQVPIHESNIHFSSFIIALDLSQPQTIVDTIEHYLLEIEDRVSKILNNLEQRGSKRPKNLNSAFLKRYGQDHPDLKLIKICPVPIVIVATKYDLFRDFEPEEKKMMAKFLRYIAHLNGASLVYVSQQDDSSITKFKSFVTNLAFKGNPTQYAAFDHSKPLAVTAGQDTFAQIGLPPSCAKASIVNYETWKSDFLKFFPQNKIESLENNPEKSSTADSEIIKYPEHLLDQLRLQKEDELEAFRKLNNRKLKEKEFSNLLSSYNISQTKSNRKGKSFSRAKASQMETT